jgi:hypothetical protein
MLGSVRVITFIIRAGLAGKESWGNDLNLVVSNVNVYDSGFFFLLYTAYMLVRDRRRLSVQ